jgi:hypothetical protein
MRNCRTITLTVWLVLALVGCATPDHVLFVTKTSLGIDFDSKPPSASIAYDRIEGYIAPSYDTGEIPPVVASVKSDGAIFNPKIRQVYATGEAAQIVSIPEIPNVTTEAPKLGGNKKLMFFGTTTTTGLKVDFSTSAVPDSLTFGFKRKEFSFIPLGTQVDADGKSYDIYPSVIASFDTAATVSTPGETGLRNAQFFATGQAARFLASYKEIREDFRAQATNDLKGTQIKRVDVWKEESKEKDKLREDIISKYKNASEKNKEEIIGYAKTLLKDQKISNDDFEDKLFVFSKEDPPAGVNVMQVLKELENKIDKLLAQPN